MNIFNVNKNWVDLQAILEDQEGELSESLESLMAQNGEDFEKAIEQCYYSIRMLESDLEVIDMEIKRLKSRLTGKENAIKRLKDIVLESFKARGIDRVKDPKYTVFTKVTKAVNITDLTLIPKEFLREKTTIEPDKTLIKDAIGSGKEVPGAEIKENKNLQLK